MSDRHLTRTSILLLLERDDEIFFLRRANTAWGNGLLSVPAGHVDKGDFVTDTVIKEAQEETGVTIKKEDLEFIHADYIFDEYCNFYFRATKWEGKPHIGEPHQASEALWINKHHLPDDITPQLKHLFKNLEKGIYFSELTRED